MKILNFKTIGDITQTNKYLIENMLWYSSQFQRNLRLVVYIFCENFVFFSARGGTHLMTMANRRIYSDLKTVPRFHIHILYIRFEG